MPQQTHMDQLRSLLSPEGRDGTWMELARVIGELTAIVETLPDADAVGSDLWLLLQHTEMILPDARVLILTRCG